MESGRIILGHHRFGCEPIDAVGPKPASKTSMKRAKKEETKGQAVNVWGGNSDVSCQLSNKS
jgi:hypothetical protein